MIRNKWYVILESKEVKKGKVIGVTRLGEKLALWRNEDDTISCIFDVCTHRGASLSGGKIIHDKLQCPFHGFEYNSDGKVEVIPANGRATPVPNRYKVNSYIVKEKHGFIWLWYGDKEKDLPEIEFFSDLDDGFSYGSFKEKWNVHYTRAIENQLDVVHLPFVHDTTIGKGDKEVVNGPVVTWKDDFMKYYVNNEKDIGHKPKKPSEIENYEQFYSLEMIMPNIWQNIIAEDIRVMAAFAPIDEENTMIYLRFYQRFVKVPLVKDLVNFLASQYNKIVLHQDRKVVLTQKPKKSELRMNENLVQGDLPIIEFRKKRQELKNKYIEEEKIKEENKM